MIDEADHYFMENKTQWHLLHISHFVLVYGTL